MNQKSMKDDDDNNNDDHSMQQLERFKSLVRTNKRKRADSYGAVDAFLSDSTFT